MNRENERAKPMVYMLLVAMLFLSMTNTLFNMPVDKIGFVAFCVIVVVLLPYRGSFRVSLLPFFIVLLSFLLSYLISIDEFEIQGFDSYLIIFFMTGIVFLIPYVTQGYRVLLQAFIISSFVYILFGVAAWCYSVLTGEVFFVKPLYGKQMADVYAAISFSTTQQVFGSIAMLNCIAIVWLRKYGIIGKPYFLFSLFISLVAIFASLNRVWLLFTPVLLLFWGGRRVLYAFLLLGIISLPVFLFYSDVMLAFGTVQSRFMMIDNLLDFWWGQEIRHVLFGRPFYVGDYFFMHGRYFTYVESGPFYLLIKFGLVGLFLVGVLSILWIGYLYKRSWFLGFFSLYYLFFVQFMTQEYLSVSFWLYWVIMFCLMAAKKYKVKEYNLA
ncbi:hypothetical protein K8374_06160 [Pseudomonas sp. p1(2021b)]|uniref:hypothetical protein n=1 Tax=Pseudomonas sp. p1(2021b) TaxID=2874628 RepID=UPI001CCC0E0E|nr:hypothetical protein [Pseudomonas sp. p1(2021b)]UBM26567.1 hypothetical protein K8374_06160 [Pseudomonas sp. p1(2021b)]